MTYKFMDKLKNSEGLVRGPKGKKPRQRYPRLGRGQIIPTAQALHQRMYTAFAEYVASVPTPFLSVLLVGSSLRQRMLEEIHDLTKSKLKWSGIILEKIYPHYQPYAWKASYLPSRRASGSAPLGKCMSGHYTNTRTPRV